MPDKSTPVWEEALGLLKQNTSQQTYQTWFEPIRLIETNDKSIILGVPNKFFKNWLEEHYAGIIADSLEKAFHKKLAPEFVILPEGEGAAAGGEEGGSEAQEKTTGKPSEEPKKPLFPFFFKKTLPSEESPLNPRYTFDNFVVGPSNRFAHAAALAVSESPAKAYNPLFIFLVHRQT